MLPDIRAVIAAILAALGLLMISFALVATYRVAQEHHSGSLQADLARRGRDALPAKSGPILIIETPGPHVLAPVEPAPAAETVAMPAVEPEKAPAPVAVTLPQSEVPQAAPVEPPIGGPLAEQPAVRPEASRNAAENPSRIDSRALERAAAEKARKVRAARDARARKAAARRAAERRAKQKAAPSFGGTFTAPGQ